MTTLSNSDFLFFQNLLQDKSGLALTPEKSYLLTTRLNPMASSLGFASLEEFTASLRKTNDPIMTRDVVEAMTTNETSFFRDVKPFNILKEILPQIMRGRTHNKTIRIWSAASSTGQECYSIAMVLKEFLQDKPDWKCQIIGTDISEEVLSQARKGEYSQFEIQRGLTIQMMMKYFEQHDRVWRVKEDLRNMVSFQHFNLLSDPKHLGTFDIIFCRNVLIYFNQQTKAKVLSSLAGRMAQDGFLFLGACETILDSGVPLTQNTTFKSGVFCSPRQVEAGRSVSI